MSIGATLMGALLAARRRASAVGPGDDCCTRGGPHDEEGLQHLRNRPKRGRRRRDFDESGFEGAQTIAAVLGPPSSNAFSCCPGGVGSASNSSRSDGIQFRWRGIPGSTGSAGGDLAAARGRASASSQAQRAAREAECTSRRRGARAAARGWVRAICRNRGFGPWHDQAQHDIARQGVSHSSSW